MDLLTTLDSHGSLVTVERKAQQVQPKLKLNFQQKCRRFAMKWFFCISRDIIDDWEHDLLIRQNVQAMIDDSCNLSDWVQMCQDAVKLERTDDIIDYTNQIVANSNITEDINSAHDIGGVHLPVGSTQSDDGQPSSVEDIIRSDCDYQTASNELNGQDLTKYRNNLASSVQHRMQRRVYRRRRRVMAYGVVCLINKARAKYFNLEDNPANRKLLGQFLIKVMRERNFRDCDISLHVTYAVDCYFSIPNSYKPSSWAR